MRTEKLIHHLIWTFDDRDSDLIGQWLDMIHLANVDVPLWAIFATRTVSAQVKFCMLSRRRGRYKEGGE